MSRTSKRIVAITVETLNELLDSDPRAEALFTLTQEGLSVLCVVNAVLASAAEGAAIVAARETDGSLVGFVPKRQKVTRVIVGGVEGAN
jgi:CBS domain-containing protein